MKDRYFVGQRVRIIDQAHTLFGSAATICESGCWSTSVHTGLLYYGYEVDVDGHGRFNPHGIKRALQETQLAPIYDGDEKTAWSESAWKPMHLRGVSVSAPENVETK